MGHALFCFLHLVAIMLGVVGLIITIPLHLIYASTRRNEKIRKEMWKIEKGKMGK